jgi:hypothetical protein
MADIPLFPNDNRLMTGATDNTYTFAGETAHWYNLYIRMNTLSTDGLTLYFDGDTSNGIPLIADEVWQGRVKMKEFTVDSAGAAMTATMIVVKQ